MYLDALLGPETGVKELFNRQQCQLVARKRGFSHRPAIRRHYQLVRRSKDNATDLAPVAQCSVPNKVSPAAILAVRVRSYEQKAVLGSFLRQNGHQTMRAARQASEGTAETTSTAS